MRHRWPQVRVTVTFPLEYEGKKLREYAEKLEKIVPARAVSRAHKFDDNCENVEINMEFVK